MADDAEKSPNLFTNRSAELWLPAATTDSSLRSPRDLLAAVSAAAWNDVYLRAAMIPGVSEGTVPSYSGETNYALSLKWRALGQNATSAATILNLIWTDLISFSIYSSQTGFGPTQSEHSANSLGRRDVQPNKHRLLYADLRFGIPAFIAVGLLISKGAGTIRIFTFHKDLQDVLVKYCDESRQEGIGPATNATPEAKQVQKRVTL